MKHARHYHYADFIWIISCFFIGVGVLFFMESAWIHLGTFLPISLRMVIDLMGIAIIGFGVYRMYHIFMGLDNLSKKILTTNNEASKFDEIVFESSSQTVNYWIQRINRYRQQHHELNQHQLSHFVDVIESMVDCVIVVNKDGIITLFNHQAAEVMGKDSLVVGRSIFSAFRRRGLADILAIFPDERRYQTMLSSRDRKKLDVWITPLKNQGFVICFDTHVFDPDYTANQLKKGEVESGVYHDFTLHQELPEKIPATPQTPIEELFGFVFDIEATGLDVNKDAAISLGGVYCHGLNIHSREVVDELILSDVKISKKSQEFHGISNQDLLGKPTLEQLWEQELQAHLQSGLLVGHQIGFDISLLQNNLHRQSQSIDWNPKYFLDTMILGYSLIPSLREQQVTLESLASFFQIPDWGRHTALGDALITSSVYASLLKLAIDAGDQCLGDLLHRQAKVSLYRNAYKSQGWISLPEGES